MSKLLGIVIANGLSPENRAFANLAGLRHGLDDIEVLHHSWAGEEPRTVERFVALSKASVTTLDFGWRPNFDGQRPLTAKVWSQLRQHYVLGRLPALAERWHSEIVYSSAQRWDCAAASRVAQRLDLPQIIHLHYPIGWWLGNHVLERLRTCTHVVAVSEFIRQELLGHGVAPERISVIRNPFTVPTLPPPETGQEIRRELGLPDDARIIGHVARLDRTKGQIETIEAFGRIAERCPQARLVIVGGQLQAGTGLSVAEVRRAADATGFGDRILVTGIRRDVTRLLASFDIFAHPSTKDASPTSVIEASAYALPVVAWDDGGVAEIVKDGVTGLLAPLGDIDGLAHRLENLIANPMTARDMGLAGRARIANLFDPARSGAAFGSLLAQVTARSDSAIAAPSR